MIVPIRTVADFAERVRPAYLGLLQTPPGQPATLEVVLAPGEYHGAAFTIGDPLDRRPIDVVLRGAEPDRPPVLADVSLRLAGDQVRLEHLVLKQFRDDLPLLHMAAGRSLAITRCAFIENQTTMRPEGRLVELVPANPDGSTTVTVRQSWFIRNWAHNDQVLLAFDLVPPYRFGQVVFDQVAFLDNHAGVGIVPRATVDLQLSHCVLYEAAAAAAPPVFVAVTSPGTRLTIEHSLLIGDGLERLVTRWSARQPSASAFQPVVISDSELVLRSPPAAGAPPEGVWLERTTISPAAPIDARAGALAAAIDRCIAVAEAGAAPDLPALRAALVAGG